MMESLNQWVIANPAATISLVFAALGCLVTLLIHLSNRALTAKDATIELLRTQNEVLTREASAYETKQHDAEVHSKLNDETIAILHKRISELEAKQFIEVNEYGQATLKGRVPKSAVKKIPDKAAEGEMEAERKVDG